MRKLLPLLPKPSRYIGTEEGSVHKRPEDVRLRVGLAFPDMYEVGMSYLGQKILYHIGNRHEHWQVERVFTPCREAAAILRAHNSPLCTLESDTPLAELDVLGISVTHELCYSNVLYLLDMGGIPLRAAQRVHPRKDGRLWPLVTMGGGCALVAEPLAPFVDVMTLGEAETSFPELLKAFERARSRGFSRHQMLQEMSRIPGVYVPEFFEQRPDGSLVPLYTDYTKAVRRVVPDMNDAPYPVRQPIPFGAVHSRLALEIGRGCTRGCRFCQAGSLYRPARERSVPYLGEILESCLDATGYDDISYLSLSTGDFSALKELFINTTARCAAEQISVSLPSLRVGSIDNAIMSRMAGIRRTGATLAPEAGSQRLRDVINKGVTEEDLILHVKKLFEHGWQQIKLYFMIGLPSETDEDLLAILDLCKKVRNAAGPGIKRLQVTASLSPFVPKAHTPFQWEPQTPLGEIRRRIGLLLDAVRKEKRIKLRWHNPEMSLLEGVFSRGDRRLANVVESAYSKGAIFTSWIEHFSLAPWLEALAEHGLTVEEYTDSRDLKAPLPWDHLHSGLSREFFLREREKALREKTSADCRYGACLQCGVCDTKAGSSLLDRVPDLAKNARYANSLNNMQRDQESHGVSHDSHGRVIVRSGTDIGVLGEQRSTTPGNAKARPPVLASHLSKKVAQARIWYSRKKRAAYLSQLEIQHIFNRALRRATIPLAFSQGFHPLPLVSFGRALPVGVTSECEWFSLYLREPCPMQEKLAPLNKALPDGLRITTVETLPLRKTNADALAETYRMDYLGSEDNSKDFFSAWQRAKKACTLPWLRETKNGLRELDCRTFFADIFPEKASCILVMDWTTGYISPLALCMQTLTLCQCKVDLPQVRLVKIAPLGL